MSKSNVGIRVPAIAVALVCLVASVAVADDWPEWRGPNRDGSSAETNWLVNWPPQEIWSADVGLGCACIAIYDGRAYATGADTNAAPLVNWVYCFDALTGTPVWSNSYVPSTPHAYGPMATPTVDGDYLYVFSQGGELICYDRFSGQQEWSTTVTAPGPPDGFSSSPLVTNGLVIVNAGTYGTAISMGGALPPGEVVWGGDDTQAGGAGSAIIVELAGVPHAVMVNGVRRRQLHATEQRRRRHAGDQP